MLRETIIDGHFTYADDTMWPTDVLQLHTKTMLEEKASAIAHRSEYLTQCIGYAAFELAMRELEQKSLESAYQEPALQS